MNCSIDMDNNILPKYCLESIISGGNGIYSELKLLDFLKGSKYQPAFKNLLSSNDFIILDFIVLKKLDKVYWNVIDERLQQKENLIKLVENLTESTGKEFIIINTEFISNLIKLRNIILSEGDELEIYSNEEIVWVTERVITGFGKTVSINIDTIWEIFNQIDKASLSLWYLKMEVK